MAERDWQKDWEMVSDLSLGIIDYKLGCAGAYGDIRRYVRALFAALRYWLKRVRELEEENAKLREVSHMTQEVELRVQLAGCSAAALGIKGDLQPSDYGWSAAYGDVVALRRRMERLEAENKRLWAVAKAAERVVDLAQREDATKEEYLKALVWLDEALAELPVSALEEVLTRLGEE
ncbi:MAG: hypothetical protein ACPLF9_08870 [Methanothermobacter tenebrarum]